MFKSGSCGGCGERERVVVVAGAVALAGVVRERVVVVADAVVVAGVVRESELWLWQAWK